jgi:hypothetical protein
MRLQSHNLRPPSCFFLRLQAQILLFRRRFSHERKLTVLVYQKISADRVRWHGRWRRKEKVPDRDHSQMLVKQDPCCRHCSWIRHRRHGHRRRRRENCHARCVAGRRPELLLRRRGPLEELLLLLLLSRSRSRSRSSDVSNPRPGENRRWRRGNTHRLSRTSHGTDVFL